ncbi:hypothetical protein EVG20_g8083 [Dentipellis fragilis]|uniref:Uncharacterized protein n=1 Tax=Dentipellis fragilis TaxID=205917 RepID=A0A4Y9Y8W4_9AGAM|nr:hypothetical protein EVG20_g8083 [Dentipellis fragilis]
MPILVCSRFVFLAARGAGGHKIKKITLQVHKETIYRATLVPVALGRALAGVEDAVSLDSTDVPPVTWGNVGRVGFCTQTRRRRRGMLARPQPCAPTRQKRVSAHIYAPGAARACRAPGGPVRNLGEDTFRRRIGRSAGHKKRGEASCCVRGRASTAGAIVRWWDGECLTARPFARIPGICSRRSQRHAVSRVDKQGACRTRPTVGVNAAASQRVGCEARDARGESLVMWESVRPP